MTNLFEDGLSEQSKPIKPLGRDDFVEGKDGERRIPDWRLAELLGFKHFRQIRELIERHYETLATRGKLSQHTTVLGRRGPAAEVYLLNRKQALFIIAQSGADNAGELVWLMVEVFDAWLDGKLRPADAQTETAIIAAADRAIDAAPELVQQLHFDFTARVASLDVRQIQMDGRVNDIDGRLHEVEKIVKPPKPIQPAPPARGSRGQFIPPLVTPRKQ